MQPCSDIPRRFPDLPDSISIVALVGRFVGGSYLPDFPECSEPHAICPDPPPLLLQFQVEERVYGPPTRPTIHVATTHHFGLNEFDFSSPPQMLVFLETDGVFYVMPKYEYVRLATDREGRLAVPLWGPDETLPCAITPPKVEIAFDGSASIARDNFTDEELHEHPEYYRISAESVSPRFGVYVDAIRAAFVNKRSNTLRREFK
jgi:hypothetical protein